MDQLHNGAQTDGAPAPIPAVPRRKEQQGRAEALAATFQQVARDLRDWLNGRAVLEYKLLLDLDQVIANQIENFLRRQK
jgi:hypothetical protein